MSNSSGSNGGKSNSFINYIDDLEKSGKNMSISPLQIKANDVRANRVNWQSYLQGQMITQEDYSIISKLDGTAAEVRGAILKENPNQCAKMFLTLMAHMSKDQTVQYVLTLIDDILQEDKSRVEIFREYARKNKESVWAPFLSMLNRADMFIVNQTARVIAKIACWGRELMEGSDLNFYLTWLKDQLKLPNEYILTVARCLQMMLRISEYRHAFIAVDGLSALMQVIHNSPPHQLQYQLTFCLWVLSFEPVIADRISKANPVPPLTNFIADANKDKIPRIVLATFRNLVEKPTEKDTVSYNTLAMVQCKLIKQLDLIKVDKIDDQDYLEDIQFLKETIETSVQDLSSLDEYMTELKSGRLEWSPVHKSEKFWRENAPSFCERNCELLKILVKVLETSKDPLILCVAIHDIGEFVRHYPRGKTFIESLGGKTMIMAMLSHEDPNIRLEALLAVQKIMVHNWEYLGKQLNTQAITAKEGNGATATKA